MQHVSQAADSVVDGIARDKRYPLTGSITEYEVRNTTTDGSEYIVLTLDRGDGRDPVKAVAFDDKVNQVMSLIDGDVQQIRLFGFFEKREFADNETGEIKTSRRYRVLWAGVPRAEGDRPQRRGQNRAQGGQSTQGQGGQGNRQTRPQGGQGGQSQGTRQQQGTQRTQNGEQRPQQRQAQQGRSGGQQPRSNGQQQGAQQRTSGQRTQQGDQGGYWPSR